MNYFEKWCCILIFLNNKGTEELSDDRIRASYDQLLQNTRKASSAINCRKLIFYDEKIDENDHWDEQSEKFLVNSGTANANRIFAFDHAFSKGYRKVVLIENNTLQLTSHHLETAFNTLKLIEFCIGTKSFGGYYLAGMNYFEPSLFSSSHIESPTFVKDYIKQIGNVKKALYKLPVLT